MFGGTGGMLLEDDMTPYGRTYARTVDHFRRPCTQKLALQLGLRIACLKSKIKIGISKFLKYPKTNMAIGKYVSTTM
jgi:hypothetical protein